VFRFLSTKTNLSHTIIVDDLKAIVTEKKIKHCYIKVNPANGDVLVSLPKGTGLTVAEKLIRSKASWIKGKKSKVIDWEHGHRKIFRDGELHKVWGAQVPLKVICTPGKRGVALDQGALVMNVPPETSRDNKEKLLKNWFAQEVRNAAARLIEKWEPVLGVKAGRLSVQKMKSRWGSCNIQNGNIRLNSELAKFPKGALEQVVVHELVHLLEPSHSKRFYSLMDNFLPNWKELKALMRFDSVYLSQL
jgi:predicted metal-dependent hydrolase